MAKVCDRCLNRKYNPVEVGVSKLPEGRKAKAVLVIDMELCEKCLTALLSVLGTLKRKFIAEGDSPPEVDEGGVSSDERACPKCGCVYSKMMTACPECYPLPLTESEPT